MTVKSTPLKKISSAIPFFEDADIEKISDDVKIILKSKKLVLGPYTKKFEDLFSKYIGTKYGIAVSSATAALEIVLSYCDVKDAEVIIPCNTFIACPNTVLYAGGKPVFADMNPNTFCLDIDDVKRKITSKTKVIMVVHLAGLPEPEMDNLAKICKERNIFLMEDCSHAHGAEFNGKKVGSLGIGGCFSFFATKIIPTGTGGMITTDDEKLQEFAEAFRHQGGIGGEGRIEVFDKFGYDFMMSEITAALGINQLEKLEKHLEKRRMIAAQYERELAKIDGVKCLPNTNPTHSYWKFITVLDKGIDRNKVRSILREQYFIDAGILYPTLCHLQPVYQNLGYREGECPVAEEVMKHQLTLPVNPFMTEEDVIYVTESLNKVIHQ
ncbi:MAG TPA: DegT/DnrJ/EryC1/StrS family aminotransferase [Nitrosopumilaceae archaeon]|nr:DegT/DnrJ/EryC1/StrS family aminotransferase [Nitrosopumilaceae archaeon]